MRHPNECRCDTCQPGGLDTGDVVLTVNNACVSLSGMPRLRALRAMHQGRDLPAGVTAHAFRWNGAEIDRTHVNWSRAGWRVTTRCVACGDLGNVTDYCLDTSCPGHLAFDNEGRTARCDRCRRGYSHDVELVHMKGARPSALSVVRGESHAPHDSGDPNTTAHLVPTHRTILWNIDKPGA